MHKVIARLQKASLKHHTETKRAAFFAGEEFYIKDSGKGFASSSYKFIANENRIVSILWGKESHAGTIFETPTDTQFTVETSLFANWIKTDIAFTDLTFKK